MSWLILPRLEDIKRDQDRLWAEFDGLRRQVQQEIASVRQESGQLRQEVDQKFTRLTGWFITGLVAILGTAIGWRFLPQPEVRIHGFFRSRRQPGPRCAAGAN